MKNLLFLLLFVFVARPIMGAGATLSGLVHLAMKECIAVERGEEARNALLKAVRKGIENIENGIKKAEEALERGRSKRVSEKKTKLEKMLSELKALEFVLSDEERATRFTRDIEEEVKNKNYSEEQTKTGLKYVYDSESGKVVIALVIYDENGQEKEAILGTYNENGVKIANLENGGQTTDPNKIKSKTENGNSGPVSQDVDNTTDVEVRDASFSCNNYDFGTLQSNEDNIIEKSLGDALATYYDSEAKNEDKNNKLDALRDAIKNQNDINMTKKTADLLFAFERETGRDFFDGKETIKVDGIVKDVNKYRNEMENVRVYTNAEGKHDVKVCKSIVGKPVK